ncbi:DEAD/DEAH box helicase [archaeon]|jgi:ATP-dependent RNA helicase DeaD|nr:DEAD/DEAH box helicase [archaeon]MBT4352691.1 DEAD/DEAH box helicase [archaeon]MBT4647446.1 DEAD/DEAH box helicase [archaeon]MBT6822397.1 DEAD/DEAH box helicase [archaeon]MBT7391578.1 DEAD/DEAH box helicase [archaeon]
MNKFKELGIMEPILKSIEEEGYDTPTEVQEKSIPLILEGKDVIAGSATGSGKTLAFACGIIHKVVKRQGIQAIVLTPTRELAEQVSESIKTWSRHVGLSVTAIYGGVAIGPQFQALERTDIVVGTPGRVLDHLERGTIDLTKIKVAVLDEADRMLDMGFIEDVDMILGECNKNRQTLLYSATISKDITRVAHKNMIDPVKVAVDSYVDPKKLSQVFYDVPRNIKFSLLVHLLKEEISGLVMVFCNTKRITDFVAKNLQKNGIEAIAIHGGLTQAKRTKTMERFHSGKVAVLVCTDVAARGLHIDDVSHIYNYDIPREPKQYVHRIGRTARAGKKGKAVNLLTSMDYENFDMVLRQNDLVIPKMEVPKVERVRVEMDSGRNDRGRGNFSRGRNNNGPRRDNNGPRNYPRGNNQRSSQGNRNSYRGNSNSEGNSSGKKRSRGQVADPSALSGNY